MKKDISSIDPAFFRNRKVLVRVDFNVPIDKQDGSIAEDSRIRAALPTIKMLARSQARVILVSHLGRPKGQRKEEMSLAPVARRLEELLEEPVLFASEAIGAVAHKTVDRLKPGHVCLLENIRFYPGEEKNDQAFAKELASLADLYVNDAFGTAHRAHASTAGVSKFLSPSLAGLLMKTEIEMLGQALDNPTRPVATIIGGAKVSTKIGVLDNLLSKVDIIVIGGAMAFSFLKARGLDTGKSLVEDDRLEYCNGLLEKAAECGVEIILPLDVICAAELKSGIPTVTVDVDKIPVDQSGLDVGPKTVSKIKEALFRSKTILWNGPLGVFEIKEFSTATFALIDDLVELTRNGATTIVGGGDSVSALKDRGVPQDLLTHVSTGGGASLEFLEGIELPGISCLDSQNEKIGVN